MAQRRVSETRAGTRRGAVGAGACGRTEAQKQHIVQEGAVGGSPPHHAHHLDGASRIRRRCSPHALPRLCIPLV